jgi:hypothetical protein
MIANHAFNSVFPPLLRGDYGFDCSILFVLNNIIKIVNEELRTET